jgi:hypothetical protein
MKITINTGRAIKHSAKAGAKKIMLYRDLIIRRDMTERHRYSQGKYLPHQNEMEMSRRVRQRSVSR